MEHCGSVGRGPRTKPQIYKTNHGKVIVEDELLNFLALKMRIMLRSLAAKTFDSKWIEAWKRVWSEVCSTTQLCVALQWPPVTFTSLDVSQQLEILERLQVQWLSGRASSWVMPPDCHQIGRWPRCRDSISVKLGQNENFQKDRPQKLQIRRI